MVNRQPQFSRKLHQSHSARINSWRKSCYCRCAIRGQKKRQDGVALITAITIAAEIGSFDRFRSPAQLMAYLGLVPREYSTGLSTRRGSMTKAGNGRLRRALIESAWSYRHRPSVKGELAKRLEEMPADVQLLSWKAQERLHYKYRKLVFGKSKNKNVAIGAVARELTGFLWAVARTVKHPVNS